MLILDSLDLELILSKLAILLLSLLKSTLLKSIQKLLLYYKGILCRVLLILNSICDLLYVISISLSYVKLVLRFLFNKEYLLYL
jgi:hypothetical protein